LEVGGFMIFYTVYRTQNLVNGKYYFGVHKTKDPYDGYLGSGRVLKHAVAKYGEQAFIKNLCFIFDNAEEAFAKEFELIETYRKDPLCYNLRQGGSGGFDWINSTPMDRSSRARTTSELNKVRMLTDPEFRLSVHKILKRGREHPNSVKALQESQGFTGRVHSMASRQKIAKGARLRTGSKNSQFGTCWITDGLIAKKVAGAEIATFLLLGWRRGRK
jgi:hypothetical protein